MDHWCLGENVTQLVVGRLLAHAPAGAEGFWLDIHLACLLERLDHLVMREALTNEYFNSRGIHSVDPTGKTEFDLAYKYTQRADTAMSAALPRLAHALRGLASMYEEDGRRHAGPPDGRGVLHVAPEASGDVGPPTRLLTEKNPFWFWPITLSGWIAAVLVWTLDLPGKVNGFYEQRDKAWTNIAPERVNPLTYPGRWTNDPRLRPWENLITDGSTQKDDGSLQLDLKWEKDGAFSGEIVSKQLGESIVPWSRVMVTGGIHWLGGFQGEVWDVVGNRHRTIAYFNLSPIKVPGGRAMRFTSDPKFSNLLPADTVLWETDAVMSGGAIGTEYRRALMDAAKQHVDKNHPP